jgi:hypothetical protein
VGISEDGELKAVMVAVSHHAHTQAPKGQPWFWTITAHGRKPSIYDRGYNASREQAMADFKTRWAKQI